MDENETLDPRVQRSREAVFEAAHRLMHDGGPSAVTYSALSEESGIGRATLYRHWPTLDRLWAEIMEMAAEQSLTELTGDLRQNLTMALRRIVDHISRDAGRSEMATMIQRAQWDGETRQMIQRFNANSPVRQALRLGIESGEISSDIDEAEASVSLSGPLIVQTLVGTEPADDALIQRTIDRFLAWAE